MLGYIMTASTSMTGGTGGIDWMAVGRRIRAAYVRAGYNRTSFAKVIDVHPTAIIAWEKGKPIKPENLEIVADMTGTTAQELMFGASSASRTQPAKHHKAWDDFLAIADVTDEERAALEGYEWPREPSITSYMLMRQALREQLSPEAAGRAAQSTERARENAKEKRLDGKQGKPGTGGKRS
jgi:DNA-binding XRE family transcriptional regulator